jgi:hypothetical protein
MDGCGYCKKAKDMFSEEINNGFIIMKNHTEAPPNVNGFPFFINTKNGSTSAGLPKNIEDLKKQLNHTNDTQKPTEIDTPITKEKYTLNSASNLLDNSKKYRWYILIGLCVIAVGAVAYIYIDDLNNLKNKLMTKISGGSKFGIANIDSHRSTLSKSLDENNNFRYTFS